MTLYTIIDIDHRPFSQLYGDDAWSIQQDIMLSSQVNSGQKLPEGKWEYRRYANGAVALVCADRESKLVVETSSGDALLLSPEAISLAANLLVLHERSVGSSQDRQTRNLSVMHQALREAIITDIPSILVMDLAPVLAVRQPHNQREVRIAPHIEAESIVLMTS